MGFNINEIVQTTAWKKFMSKVYGWGAAVVLVGALFKIQHYPGASLMLVIGLSTEAFIFFMSAFEPLHVEYDWTLAYPELAGIEMEEAHDTKKEKKKRPLDTLQELLDSANIGPEVFKNLGVGFNKLNQTTSQLASVTDAMSATNNYVSNMKNASDSATLLSSSYAKTSDILNTAANKSAEMINISAQKLTSSYDETANKIKNSFGNLADSYSKSAELVEGSATQLADSYMKLSEKIIAEVKAGDKGIKSYEEQLEVMNKNLSALNAVYELQLQNSNEHLKSSEQIYSNIGVLMESLKESADDAKKYQTEVAKLGKNLAALNTVYGNMLSAMNINVKQ